MTSPSPSEFLTFYRYLTISSTFRCSQPVSRQLRRQFSAFSKSRANTFSDRGIQRDSYISQGIGAKRQYALDEGNRKEPNVQTTASYQGRETYAEFSRDRARAHDTGGNATRERDENDSTAKAKQENPEAPDVVIGMQDERGGKGI
ncbi:hypothetical protein M433DRAFT_173214 [Acidomyces richmondensis BFW]|nr:MAG: hypothetical protein FE78DRAFT_97939 [Acidomyces sp. 'richmondensis']KYG46993.1 hypothetical protein M433DRAFT_173214 [Acidomyces richmondensis BFW]